MTGAELCERLFQSTPPVRGGDNALIRAVVPGSISIHAPREGGDEIDAKPSASLVISIHAPREGGDFFIMFPLLPLCGISIHAPREGGDGSTEPPKRSSTRFQSTPPTRGATEAGIRAEQERQFQSTPPTRGATALVGSGSSAI